MAESNKELKRGGGGRKNIPAAGAESNKELKKKYCTAMGTCEADRRIQQGIEKDNDRYRQHTLNSSSRIQQGIEKPVFSSLSAACRAAAESNKELKARTCCKYLCRVFWGRIQQGIERRLMMEIYKLCYENAESNKELKVHRGHIYVITVIVDAESNKELKVKVIRALTRPYHVLQNPPRN